MSKQIPVSKDEFTNRRLALLVHALDGGLAESLETQGIELLGFAVRYDAFNSLMTIKAYFNNKRQVCFVGSESIIGCVLKAQSDSENDRLQWREDKYYPSEI